MVNGSKSSSRISSNISLNWDQPQTCGFIFLKYSWVWEHIFLHSSFNKVLIQSVKKHYGVIWCNNCYFTPQCTITGESLLQYILAAGLTFRNHQWRNGRRLLKAPNEHSKSLGSLELDPSKFYVGCKSDLTATLQMLQQYFNNKW